MGNLYEIPGERDETGFISFVFFAFADWHTGASNLSTQFTTP
jgi:hypothetical protein